MSLLTEFAQLNTSKYKRFFVIGCSFTEWYWPTWANIIAEQNLHLEFYSFAKPGQGNTYISTLLNQLTHTHNLCETDLVGIMWSSFHRLDYYTSSTNLEYTIRHRPEIEKNSLHNWRMYSDSIHAQLKIGTKQEGYCDRGFLLRDLAIIDNATTVMEHAPYTAFQMYSIEPEQQNNYDPTFNNIHRDNSDAIDTYSHLQHKMVSKTSLFNEMGNTFTTPTVTWIPSNEPEDSSKKEVDCHPPSSIYCQFLQNNGYTLTPRTLDKCKFFDTKIQKITWAGQVQHNKDWPYKVMVQNKDWPL